MRKISFLIITVLAFSCQQETNKSEGENQINQHEHTTDNNITETPKKKPKSPKTSAMGNIGSNHVHIDYSSPSVRGRQIWGSLVPYGEVWASGAHKANTITFSEDVIIGETDIPKGKYAFFTIPGEKEWTVIINKNWDQHLADEYDEKDDIVKVTVQPEENEHVEALRYAVVSGNETTGYIHLEWRKLIIALQIDNK